MDAPMTSYDELEAAAVEAQTPPRYLPSFSSTTTPTSVSDSATDSPEVQDSPYKFALKKPSLTVRPTKASEARITIAHGPKDRPQIPALGRPAAQSKEVTKRTLSNSSHDSNEPDEIIEKKELIIPHSKPRPMGIAFPPPPPPTKSTKAPTQSNFQLPGEAIAAKLKAAKEARLQKETDEQKKRTFKARPVPASVARGAAVRQTSTSKARELLIASTKPVINAPTEQQRVVSNSSTTSTISRPATSSSNVSSNSSLSAYSNSNNNSFKPRPKVEFSDILSFSSPSSSRPSTATAQTTSSNSLNPVPLENISRSRTPSLEDGKPFLQRPSSAIPTVSISTNGNPTIMSKNPQHLSASPLDLAAEKQEKKHKIVRKMVAQMEGKGVRGTEMGGGGMRSGSPSVRVVTV